MTRPIHITSPADAPEPRIPGEPFRAVVCICRECDRLLTAHASVSRGRGPTCFARSRERNMQARLEAQGQQRFTWAEDAGARA